MYMCVCECVYVCVCVCMHVCVCMCVCMVVASDLADPTFIGPLSFEFKSGCRVSYRIFSLGGGEMLCGLTGMGEYTFYSQVKMSCKILQDHNCFSKI